MIKKEYIQPEAKEIEVKIPTILAGSIKNTVTNYSISDNDNMDDDELGDGDDAL